MKENAFELLRELKRYARTTDIVHFNGVGLYHDRTLYNRIQYEKERTIVKCRNIKKRTFKDCLCLQRKQYLSFIHFLSRVRDDKKVLRSKLRDSDTDRRLSMFKKINDYTR